MTHTRTIDVDERAAFWASTNRRSLSDRGKYDLDDVDDELEEICRAYNALKAENERLTKERDEALGAPNGCHRGGLLIEHIERDTAERIAATLRKGGLTSAARLVETGAWRSK